MFGCWFIFKRDEGGEVAEIINDDIKNGRIVKAEITIGLLEKAMRKHGWEKSKFLIDGFPRDEDNLAKWNSMMGSKIHTKFLLWINVSEVLKLLITL